MELSKLKIYDSKDFPTYLPKLNNLYDDLFSGGKGFRSKLVKKVSDSLSLPDQTFLLLAQTIEFIHNASLLHDDLIDRSELRRGKTTAWLKYTPEYAVLAGDYLLARVMVNLSKFGNVRLIQYTAEMISDLLEGEWIQDSLVGNYKLSLEQLDRVHELKTASLFKWCLRAPFIAAENNDEATHEILEEMGSLLGRLFQRSDDLLDFDIRNYEGKAVLGDLKSGYLNSAGVFLLKGIEQSKFEKTVQSTSLGQLTTIVGQDYFDSRISEFDDLNKQSIELYAHLNSQLKSLIPNSAAQLPQDLEPLGRLLYWRKKD